MIPLFCSGLVVTKPEGLSGEIVGGVVERLGIVIDSVIFLADSISLNI